MASGRMLHSKGLKTSESSEEAYDEEPVVCPKPHSRDRQTRLNTEPVSAETHELVALFKDFLMVQQGKERTLYREIQSLREVLGPLPHGTTLRGVPAKLQLQRVSLASISPESFALMIHQLIARQT
ncbi:hypothetical protein JZ751_010123 [Albula glossodonta]|uniref:Uncharacterized protein n=1 Tax=Albula glossodonta TaxID=121402 RepID=A0A8T2N5E8_9TELE|nr:hypothetical protein JZ751_010123 [Albula glossodonta]